ncbi:MAG: hypothetical protein M9931_07215 [Chitinophagales bacterium]|nr:hypothetical protein [Chitinophagales bacterium]
MGLRNVCVLSAANCIIVIVINIPQNVGSYFQCENAVCFYRKGSAVKGKVTFFKYGNKLLGIGCYHVLCADEMARKIYSIDFKNAENSPLVLMRQTNDGSEHETGKIIYGKLNDREDITLIEVTEKAHLQLKAMPFLSATDSDLFIVKANGTIRTANIIEHNALCEINLNGQLKLTFKELIKTDKISNKGDSGILVWNKAGNLKGIIEADNEIFSYVLPLTMK